MLNEAVGKYGTLVGKDYFLYECEECRDAVNQVEIDIKDVQKRLTLNCARCKKKTTHIAISLADWINK